MWKALEHVDRRTASQALVDENGRTFYRVVFPTDDHEMAFHGTVDLLMGHEARANPKALPETAITRAFEREAHVKITRQLADENPEIRRRANEAAPEHLNTPQGRSNAIDAGIVPNLVALLREDDPGVRSQACANLRLVAKTEKGAEACAAGGEDSACRALVAAISDDDRAVQAAALRTLEQLCMWQCGADTVVRMNSVLPGLVSSVEGEPDLRALQLNLVRACLARRGNDLALAQCLDHRGADGVDVCTRTLKQHCAKLTAPVAPLVVVAASVLTLLCFRADAKEKAVEAGAVPVLVRCMAASDMAVKIAATRAAACIMTCVPGKLAFFDSGGANVLQSMLLVKHDPLLIVALNCMCAAAQEPRTRVELRRFKPLIMRVRAVTRDLDVVRAADECARQLEFETRPFPLKAGYAPAVDPREVDHILANQNLALASAMRATGGPSEERGGGRPGLPAGRDGSGVRSGGGGGGGGGEEGGEGEKGGKGGEVVGDGAGVEEGTIGDGSGGGEGGAGGETPQGGNGAAELGEVAEREGEGEGNGERGE